MPIATRTFPADINPPITQANLIAGLRDALIAAGFPQPLKSYASGTDQFVVWQLNFDAAKTYGKAFYRLKVTSGLIVTHAIGAGFTDANNILLNPSTDSHPITYLSNVALKSWGFASSELLLVSVSQGSLHQLLGYFRFADVPAFDEASFPKIFLSRDSAASSLTSTSLSPYSSPIFSSSLANDALGNPDPYLQQRSQVTGILLYVPNNCGVMGRSSEDLASGSCIGMVRGDVFQNPSVTPPENFILLRPGAGALLIRI